MKKLLSFLLLLAIGCPSLASATTYATWNPSDKSAAITLSAGNLTVKNTGADGQVGVRSTISKTSGKWYWEAKLDSYVGDTNYAFGVANAGATLSNPYNSGGGAFVIDVVSGNYRYATGVNEACGTAFVTNDIVGIALDQGASTIKFYKNNTLLCTKTLPVDTYFAATYPYRISDQTTANFGATALTYSPPSGYCAGLVDTCPGGATADPFTYAFWW